MEFNVKSSNVLAAILEMQIQIFARQEALIKAIDPDAEQFDEDYKEAKDKLMNSLYLEYADLKIFED